MSLPSAGCPGFGQDNSGYDALGKALSGRALSRPESHPACVPKRLQLEFLSSEHQAVNSGSAPRRRTRAVMVGGVGIGGGHPIRVQSMISVPALDVEGAARQIAALAEAGCEIIRLAVPNLRAARALPEIRKKLAGAKITIPLAADIHYLPAAALEAARHVEKVRINPGNFAWKNPARSDSYTDSRCEKELARQMEAFAPLSRRCREMGRAIRVGVNHGSLSERVLWRYGNTPEGLVASALEFIRAAEAEEFRDLVVSIKASHPVIMIEANRLLVSRMDAQGMDYPLHIGLTEAGAGEDARFKSAAGIGSLLLEGLGDTIRVSLTEDPVREIPFARALVRQIESWRGKDGGELKREVRPAEREKVEVRAPAPFGAGDPPRVLVRAGRPLSDCEEIAREINAYNREHNQQSIEGVTVELDSPADIPRLEKLHEILGKKAGVIAVELKDAASLQPLRSFAWPRERVWIIVLPLSPGCPMPAAFIRDGRRRGLWICFDLAPETLRQRESEWKRLGAGGILFKTRAAGSQSCPAAPYRQMQGTLDSWGFRAPLWLDFPGVAAADELSLAVSMSLGSLLCDGMGSLVSISAAPEPAEAAALAYGILQAARRRLTRAEIIACPGCGRTLFDLESAARHVRERFGHLSGLTIAVMGCAVNGPGEMADADFGYVGGAPGKVNLYAGKECVERGVPEAVALDRLAAIIRERRPSLNIWS